MKLFVWTGAALQTDFIGGLIVVAADLEHARIDWRDHHYLRDALFRDCVPRELPAPDRAYEVDPYSRSEIIVFSGPGAA